MSLICPKCSSEMKSYERNRILVDQCTGCGGLFLDKGELEHLAAAENAWHASQTSAPSFPPNQHDDRPRDDRPRDDRPRDDRPRDDRPRYDDDRPKYDDRPRYDDRRDGGSYKPRKKKSFLSEMFDD